MENETNVNNQEQNNDTNVDNKIENISMTKIDYDKAIQSAEDKVRTSYSKKVKDLEEEIKKLTPVEKTKSELEIEAKLLALEKRQAEIDNKESFMKLQETLTSKGIDKQIAEYLKDGVDLDKFSALFGDIQKDILKNNSYQPKDHNNTSGGITKEQFKAMNYGDKAKLFETNPNLYAELKK